jgi:hypothetical protein
MPAIPSRPTVSDTRRRWGSPESREKAIFAERQALFDMLKLKADVTGVNQTFIVSLFDIVEQFFGVKIGAIRNKSIPGAGPLPHQFAAKQAGEVAHDLIAALLSCGHERHKTTQCPTPDPLVGALIFD